MSLGIGAKVSLSNRGNADNIRHCVKLIMSIFYNNDCSQLGGV